MVNHSARFERLWEDSISGVNVYSPTKDLLEVAKSFAQEGKSAYRHLKASSKTTSSENADPNQLPLLGYQRLVIKNWEANGYRGIVQFCTGAGKTFVGLEAIRRNSTKNIATLVLVPSGILLNQWASEIEEKLHGARVILANKDNAKWKDKKYLSRHLKISTENKPCVLIATLGTAQKVEFVELLSSCSDIALIGDEVHQTGAPVIRASLSKLHPIRVMGLSATPERFGDEEGTNFVFDYFGSPLEPVIGLEEAIAMKRLVPYEYKPLFVPLIEEEASEWQRLSLEIARLYARGKADGNSDMLNIAEIKILERSRIAKKAEGKISIARQVLSEHFESGDKWLVYCEDGGHLEEVKSSLAGLGIPLIVYHSKLSSEQRSEALKWIKWNSGIVISIRCLDEGVDIPSVNKALILASSQNPRQFIQRRGRVLRKADGKSTATLFDTLVLPPQDNADASHFKSLIDSEIRRAHEFAMSATNKSAAAAIESTLASIGVHTDMFYEEENDE